MKDLKAEKTGVTTQIKSATATVACQYASAAATINMASNRAKPQILTIEKVRTRMRVRCRQPRLRAQPAEQVAKKGRAEMLRNLFGDLSCSDEEPPTATRTAPTYTIRRNVPLGWSRQR